MAFSLGEYQDIFLEEADEQLQELNQNLLHLEKNPDDIDVINNIFRAAHSLKSSAAFVGLNDLSDLAHKMENLLQGIRDRTMQVSPQIIQVLFNCFDVISALIDTVASGRKPEADLSEIIARIQELSDSPAGAAPAPRGEEAREEYDDGLPKTSFTVPQMRQIKEALQSGKSCCEITVHIDPNAQMKWLKAQLVLQNAERIGTVVTTLPAAESLNEKGAKDYLKLVLLTDASVEEVKKACDVDLITQVDLRKISVSRKDDKTVIKFHERETIFEESREDAMAGVIEASEADADEREKEMAEEDEEEQYKMETVRRREDKKAPSLKIVKVSVDKLDQLLNNVGELVIANSGFFKLYEEIRRHTAEKAITNEFKNRMDQMSRIAKDLQSGIMKTRMVPIGQVFSRFNRLVRDLAKEFGKNVRLEVKGEDTELDKKVIDAIGEPLMHLIRNAIDHGVETPEERIKLNKPETATLSLNAYQSGNQIFVLVSDDGRGLNVSKIKKIALQKGLATHESIANMSDEEILNFIYAPGFSTSEVVTDISGRGVGMNVVKEIVSELNGSVSIETEPGMGTRFVLAFPLTLAIIPAIMVRVRRELYAIPLSDVIETIKISNADVTTIEGHEVINLRGEILSLLRLNEFVGLESAIEEGQKVPVVVVGYGNRKIGLIVDFLEGKQEIVIKSLEQNYTTVEGLAGASILGDGSICLILDIASMINKVIAEQDRISRAQRERIAKARQAVVEEVKELPQQGVVERVEAVGRDIASAPEAAGSPTALARESAKEFKAEIKEDILFEKEKAPLAAKAEPEPVKEAPAVEPPAAPKAGPEMSDEEVDERVKNVLQSFKDELRDTIRTSVEQGSPDEHIKKSLQMSEADIESVQVLANIGIANAATSLSKILNKRIDLSIPEVSLMPVEKIPESVGRVDSVYIGVYMPLVGDFKGTILFSLIEESAFELVSLLYGMEVQKTKELDEDGESALIEVTNIIGSSVVNVFSEKTGMPIKPTVPTVVHDYMQSILDSILVMHNITNDYALIMETEFYHQDDKVIGELLILPETESLKKIVARLR